MTTRTAGTFRAFATYAEVLNFAVQRAVEALGADVDRMHKGDWHFYSDSDRAQILAQYEDVKSIAGRLGVSSPELFFPSKPPVEYVIDAYVKEGAERG